MNRDTLAAWVVVLSCWHGCSGSSGESKIAVDLVTDGTTTDVDPADAATDQHDREPLFTHEILVFTQEAARSGIATGEFQSFSVEYPSIPIPDHLAHHLTFLVSPMMPPWRRDLLTHGPVILFSDDFETWVLSPMDHFFVSLLGKQGNQLRLGVGGEVDQLPAGFTHRFLLVKGQGISATVQHWGSLMLADRGKDPVPPDADLGVSHLGYWTDNGAWYYYKKEPGMTEEETLLAVKAEADALGVPYRYFQLDSWWYPKAKGAGVGPGGLLRWEPIPEMFPRGLAAFQQDLGLPLVLHNRWFDVSSPYVQEYPFSVGDSMAFPAGPEVFQHFMDNAASWGAITYEQDWLVSQYWGFPALRSDPQLGKNWMLWMDESARQQRLTMQLCMSGAAHLMQSLDMTTPTTIRTSIDYAAGISKESFWGQFHTVNLVAWSLGLWPFKDNFQSAEVHGEAEALISALSGGMTGPGDGLGRTRADIILRTCTQGGLLLKPDRPAFPIDSWFLPHQRPLIVTTRSHVPGQGPITYLAAFHLASAHPDRSAMDVAFAVINYEERDLNDVFVFPEEVTRWDVDLMKEAGLSGEVLVYNWRTGEASVQTAGLFQMPELPGLYDFHYYILSPVSDHRLVLVGETDKYITASRNRISDVRFDGEDMVVSVTGEPGESVSMLAYDTVLKRLLTPVSVVLDGAGQGQIRLSGK